MLRQEVGVAAVILHVETKTGPYSSQLEETPVLHTAVLRTPASKYYLNNVQKRQIFFRTSNSQRYLVSN